MSRTHFTPLFIHKIIASFFIALFLLVITSSIYFAIADEFSNDRKPIDIAFVYDDSTSMMDGKTGDGKAWGQTKYGLEIITAWLREDDSMKVFPLTNIEYKVNGIGGEETVKNDDFEIDCSSNQNGQSRVDSVADRQIKSNGDTPPDQMKAAAEYLKEKKSNGKKYLIVATDGEFSTSTSYPNHHSDEENDKIVADAFNIAESNGITVCYLALGVKPNPILSSRSITYDATDKTSSDNPILDQMLKLSYDIFNIEDSKFAEKCPDNVLHVEKPSLITIFNQGKDTAITSELEPIDDKGNLSKDKDKQKPDSIKVAITEKDIPDDSPDELKNTYKDHLDRSLQGSIANYPATQGNFVPSGYYKIPISSTEQTHILIREFELGLTMEAVSPEGSSYLGFGDQEFIINVLKDGEIAKKGEMNVSKEDIECTNDGNPFNSNIEWTIENNPDSGDNLSFIAKPTQRFGFLEFIPNVAHAFAGIHGEVTPKAITAENILTGEPCKYQSDPDWLIGLSMIIVPLIIFLLLLLLIMKILSKGRLGKFGPVAYCDAANSKRLGGGGKNGSPIILTAEDTTSKGVKNVECRKFKHLGLDRSAYKRKMQGGYKGSLPNTIELQGCLWSFGKKALFVNAGEWRQAGWVIRGAKMKNVKAETKKTKKKKGKGKSKASKKGKKQTSIKKGSCIVTPMTVLEHHGLTNRYGRTVNVRIFLRDRKK